ncbi:uncharacterized protein TNCV_4230171 [Trichonephila clavipes]|uniref:Uncharacterized protein n=1 Tax=Trichonephila clavipes TaxID=2585209 RepID=A0A8X6SHH7_TRICX|nr:uncharacterized protein TNCV_4230171 [Trichonephila clavipes]
MTLELAPPLLTTTPHQREDVSALDRFSVHRCPTRRVFSGTGLEPVTKQATVRYLYHSATAAFPHTGEILLRVKKSIVVKSELIRIDIAQSEIVLLANTNSTGDGLHNFELRSSDEDET